MNILLDTCALLWLVNRDRMLSPTAREALQNAPMAFLSSASVWELGIKVAKGKLKLPEPLAPWLQKAMARHDLTELPLDHASALRSSELPPLHSDPADRLLAAAAQQHQLTLLTPDPLLQQYPNLKTLW